MDPGRRLYFKNRQEWRGWLEDNHHKEKEVWLVIYKKQAEKPGIQKSMGKFRKTCGWLSELVHFLGK